MALNQAAAVPTHPDAVVTVAYRRSLTPADSSPPSVVHNRRRSSCDLDLLLDGTVDVGSDDYGGGDGNGRNEQPPGGWICVLVWWWWRME